MLKLSIPTKIHDFKQFAVTYFNAWIEQHIVIQCVM